MTTRNKNFNRLSQGYLFPEINRRKRAFQETHPECRLISLGIGDTTEAIPLSITDGLVQASVGLGTKAGYSGYGPEQGDRHLRELIAGKVYKCKLSPDDIFISDGAKCDIGRLQQLFGNNVTVAVQDPAYPVYVDGSIIQGVETIVYLPCLPENDFWPDWKNVSRTDLIYLCSPNNPTGKAATKEQLREVVAYAKKNSSVILFDAAYATYIQDPTLPSSIFDIEGADEVAIELNSFSKMAGFTGVRLGWTAIKETLKYDDGAPIKADWKRLISTVFNGASNIAQNGGVAALLEQGRAETKQLAQFYLENAAIIKQALSHKHLEVYGGTHAPFLWVRFPGRDSWEVFQELLTKAYLVTTPGAGFGPSGEGFVRFSAFGHREQILEAAIRLNNFFASLR